MWNDPIQMDWNRFKWIDMNCFFFCASIGLWASFQVPEPPRYFGTASESCIFWTKVVTFFEGCGCTKPSSRFIEILKIAVTDNGTINDHHLPRPFTSSKTNTTQWFNGLYKKWRGGSALDWKVHSTWTLSQSWLSSLENLFVGQLYRLQYIILLSLHFDRCLGLKCYQVAQFPWVPSKHDLCTIPARLIWVINEIGGWHSIGFRLFETRPSRCALSEVRLQGSLKDTVLSSVFKRYGLELGDLIKSWETMSVFQVKSRESRDVDCWTFDVQLALTSASFFAL